jgi:hypothetical protein
VVSLALDICPACGAAFLARLQGDLGRHRSDEPSPAVTRLQALPRPARLIGGILAGVLLAVLVPVLVALLG